MSRFSSRSPQAVLAGLILLAGPAAAQAPQPAPPPAPPPASAAPQTAPAVPQTAPAVPPSAPALVPPPPLPQPAPVAPPVSASAIDPQVRTLFSQAVAAHQALSSLYAMIAHVSTGSGPAANSVLTIRLVYKKPGYAKVVVSAPAGQIVQFLSDNKSLTLYAVQPKQYRVQPIPAGADPVALILSQARALLPRLLGNPAAINDLLAQPGISASVVSPSSATPAHVGGVAVDTVTVVLPAPDGSKATFTFDIGKTDHLLRRLTENASLISQGKPQSFTVTETVTLLKANPALTAASFTFIPPPGVTKIQPATPPAQPPVPSP